jgi:hypothetical protein
MANGAIVWKMFNLLDSIEFFLKILHKDLQQLLEKEKIVLQRRNKWCGWKPMQMGVRC